MPLPALTDAMARGYQLLQREVSAGRALYNRRSFWSGLLKVAFAIGLSRWLRSLLRHFWWHRGMFVMLRASLMVNFRRFRGQRQEYRVELHEHPHGEACAVWWPIRRAAPALPKRLWVLVPGGMSDGDSVAGYFDELLSSKVIDKSKEDWCLFHTAGTGGAEFRQQTFAGLSDPSFLLDYLRSIGAYSPKGNTAGACRYREVIVLGFSAGGMLTLAAADEVFNKDACQNVEVDLDKPTILTRRAKVQACRAAAHQKMKADDSTIMNEGGLPRCRLRFVSVHSPDHLRRTFEAIASWSWFARIDIPLALHFWVVNLRNRLLFKCPQGRLLPWPPTWWYIRHLTEAAWAQNEARKKRAKGENVCAEEVTMPFEHFDNHFSLQLRAPLPPGEVLRIQNPEDPVVDLCSLDPKCLQCCDVWWFREGGHVMCFGASPELVRRLRKWVEHQPICT
mmetsp:Transcript_57547/g.134809  ORF Transcript_57547/g.134809 Transcript_57547/m.134809 type:complete len:449 (+) Transcript_57547:37-1383(+)